MASHQKFSNGKNLKGTVTRSAFGGSFIHLSLPLSFGLYLSPRRCIGFKNNSLFNLLKFYLNRTAEYGLVLHNGESKEPGEGERERSEHRE